MEKVVVHLANAGWEMSSSGCHAKGAAFTGTELHRDGRLTESLPPASAGTDEWAKTILRFNGFFAVVAIADRQIVAAVDRVRSVPLFYGMANGTFYLSDDAEWVRDQVGDIDMDPIGREEFKLAGYVTGPDTLFPHVKQIQAGEMLCIDQAESYEPVLTRYRYYRFAHTEPTDWNEGKLKAELDEVLEATARRLIDYANGRQIIIPLSGGYDSRLLAIALKKYGYPNILSFTYGVSRNREAEYSRIVAQALDLPWVFVEYTKEKWLAAWGSDDRRRYQQKASGYASLAHLQDWLAVRELENAGAVEEGAVFAPGHTADFVAGGHIPICLAQFEAGTRNRVAKEILRAHYSLAPFNRISRRPHCFWLKRIDQAAGGGVMFDIWEAADLYERWEWQERQAKFIVNAVQVYEFYGYNWWLPYWDAEFVEFWGRVPLSLRLGRRWYIQYVQGMGGTVQPGSSLGKIKNASRLSRINAAAKKFASFGGEAFYNAAWGVFKGRQLERHPLNPYWRLDRDFVSRHLNKGYGLNGIDAEAFLREI